ncbi:MAG TPA: alpha/beta hydrolase [Blastocatellia bacterium]|nr:alpha/beta hydrolase [Blastocatellia bacterium]
MRFKIFFTTLILIAVSSVTLRAEQPAPGRNAPVIRGHKLDVYYYPAKEPRTGRAVLFAPGDGGWRGFAITLAELISSWGYDVYGLDTKTYLESFTRKSAALKEADVMGDMKEIARWITSGSSQKITLVGWSEGAGITLLGAAGDDKERAFNGLVTFGLGKSNVLGWRWSDDFTYITKKDPDEPKFDSSAYMPKVSPLPLLMIQSARDEYVPADEAKALFNQAKQPKRFALIQADDHRFDGNRDQFYRTLREGLEWINKTQH